MGFEEENKTQQPESRSQSDFNSFSTATPEVPYGQPTWGHYVYDNGQSGYQNNTGSFSGYQTQPYGLGPTFVENSQERYY